MTLRFLSPVLVFVCFGCAGAGPGSGATQTTAAAETVRHPADPVPAPETIAVELAYENGHLDRLYVPVTKDGVSEHTILDSGTARTWFRLDGATQDFTADAFVGKLGDSLLSVFGRRVPASDEIVDGRPEIGAIGIDFFSAGPTELDLRHGRLIRYPAHFEVGGENSRITNNTALGNGAIGIGIELNRTGVVTGNRISNIGYACVEVYGDSGFDVENNNLDCGVQVGNYQNGSGTIANNSTGVTPPKPQTGPSAP